MTNPTFFDPNKLLNIAYAASLILIGYLIAKHLSLLSEKALKKRFSRHHTQLIKRALFYIIFAMFVVTGLQHVGFKLSVLLGAAGVFTVAISFASQTAASNLISGIFLLFEHPFKVGDSVTVNNITGTVEAIDLLSTKLKTAENTLVRIPNESMIKSDITNLSYFKTRRLTVVVHVDYEHAIPPIKSLLLDIAHQCEYVLPEPAPVVAIENFESLTVDLRLTVSVKTAQATTAKNELSETIKQRFDEAGIKGLGPRSTLVT